MIIRQLTEADAEIFRAFRLRSLRESPRAFTNSYEEYSQQKVDSTAQRFRAQVASGVNFTLGAFEDGQLVGSVGFYREEELKLKHKGHIVSMYVAPEYRGRGIARELLRAAIRRAKQVSSLSRSKFHSRGATTA